MTGKIIEGDLIELAKNGEFDVIVHGCNCFCTMRAGFASQLVDVFPIALVVDRETKSGDKQKLGRVTWARDKDSGVIIVNGYTQYSFRGPKPRVDYDAVREVMKEIKCRFPTKRIAYPMIGAGLAGGDWETIYQIIKEELEGTDHTLVKLTGG